MVMTKDEALKMKEYINDIQMSDEVNRLRSALMHMSQATAKFIMDRYISEDRQSYIKNQVYEFIFDEVNKRYPRWEDLK